MKKSLLFAFTSLAILFSSCDKGTTYPFAPSLYATINKVNWATNSVTLNSSGNQFSINAPNPYGGNFVINMPSNITAGTYALSQTGEYNAIYTNDLNGTLNNFYSVSGTLVIALSPPGQLEGTFSFTAANILNASDVITVNNGVFSLNNF